MEITTSQLKAALGGVEILKGVGVSLRDGEFVGIIGPDANGKSTRLKCI